MCRICCQLRRRFGSGASDVTAEQGDQSAEDGSSRLFGRGFFKRSNSIEDNGNPPKEDRKVRESEWQKALEIEGIEQEQRLWVEHSAFESFIGFMILLSTICTGLEIDLEDTTDPAMWLAITNIFCVAWISEMIAKLWVLRKRYFQDPLNYVDMALVVLSVFDAWIMPFIEVSSGNLILFRLLRLMRLLRLVKLLQVLRRFRNLWLMVQGLVESVSTLNWVILMLCLVMYSFAVCLRLAVDCNGAFSDWTDCEQFFGTIPKIMYSLVQVITLESWNMTIGRPLVEREPLLFVLLLLFIFLTTFGLLNIIVGVIVENTLNIAQSDQELQDRRMRRQMLHELEFLRQVFEEADFDCSGTLDKEEFVEICQRHEVKQALLRMEIPAEQPEELFDILDEDQLGQITSLQFHESVKKVRGNPTAFDMKNMMVSVSDIMRRQNRLQAQHDRTQQMVYAIFGKTPPARSSFTPGRLTAFDLEDATTMAMLQRKSGVLQRAAKLKRGGSMQSIDTNGTDFGIPATPESPGPSPISRKKLEDFLSTHISEEPTPQGLSAPIFPSEAE